MDVNLLPLLPAAQVLLTAWVVMLLDLFLKENEKGLLAWIGLLGWRFAGWKPCFCGAVRTLPLAVLYCSIISHSSLRRFFLAQPG